MKEKKNFSSLKVFLLLVFPFGKENKKKGGI